MAAEEWENRVLVLMPTAKAADRTLAVLARSGIACAICADLAALCRELQAGAGAALLTESILLRDPAGRLTQALREQPAWSAIPLIVLTVPAPLGVASRLPALAGAALAGTTPNVTLVERPLRMRTLVSVVQGALRARRHQYDIRDSLAERARQTEALREALEAVRQTEERLRFFANSIPQLAWMAQPDGHIFWYNDRWYHYTGATAADMEGWGWTRIHDPKVLPAVIEKWSASLASGQPFDMTFPLRGADGVFRPFLTRVAPLRDATGKIVLWFGTNTDITDQERAAAVLRAAKSYAEGIVATVPQPLLVLDQEQRIRTANDAFYDTFGVNRGETEGRLIYDLGNGQWNIPELRRLLEEVLPRGSGLDGYEVHHTFQHLGPRVMSLNARRVEDPSREAFVLLAFDDITQRREAETQKEHLLQAERAARAEAERVGRMKDEFLATLSHELRTPLNAILGWAQILRQSGQSDEDFAQGMEAIERNARAQTQLIEDLLDMSRIISGKIRLNVRSVMPAEVVIGAIEAVKPAATAKGVRLVQLMDPAAGPVRGDPGRLQQVVWNLLANAVKFTPKEGRVQVAVQRVDSQIQISVTDTGKGIRAEFLPYVFERFRQEDASTTRKFGGLGLGLSIVKNLVELHGGTVRATSDGEGRGATFTVLLPLAVTKVEERPTETQARRAAEGDGLEQTLESADCDALTLTGVTVLVVDDERDAREVLKRILENRGARVLLAASASEALALLSREKPTLLLSDIGMPEMDGYELIRRVRALPSDQGGNMPAVALTAFARSEDRRRALVAGFQMHIAKPAEPAELLAACASLASVTLKGATPTTHSDGNGGKVGA